MSASAMVPVTTKPAISIAGFKDVATAMRELAKLG